MQWVALDLFTRQSSYPEHDFVETWQSHLPGIVDDGFYDANVTTADLLKGIAVLDNGNWVYAPSS